MNTQLSHIKESFDHVACIFFIPWVHPFIWEMKHFRREVIDYRVECFKAGCLAMGTQLTYIFYPLFISYYVNDCFMFRSICRKYKTCIPEHFASGDSLINLPGTHLLTCNYQEYNVKLPWIPFILMPFHLPALCSQLYMHQCSCFACTLCNNNIEERSD